MSRPPDEIVKDEIAAHAVCESDISRTCQMNWPDSPASWCLGCLAQGALALYESEQAATQAMRKVAKEATNGWACVARTKRESAEIARLHAAIDEVDKESSR